MQLLANNKNIYETLMQGVTMDAVLLDFPKASDQVNYRILFNKGATQKISYATMMDPRIFNKENSN